MTQNMGPIGSARRWSSHRSSCSRPTRPCRPYGDAGFAAPDAQRATAVVQIWLAERERFGDPQAGAPEKHDECAEALAAGAVAGGAHDGSAVGLPLRH
jgi:hypothetical protein